MFGRGRGSGAWTSVFLRGGGSSMGGATTSTSGSRSPVRCSSFRRSRCRKGEVLFRSLLRFRLLLARLRLRLFGRRRWQVRLSLIGKSIPYKGLLVISHVLLINSANLPVKQKFRGKRERQSFLFASSVKKPLGADSMAASRLNCWRPSVWAVTMDIASVKDRDMDLRISNKT